MKLPEESNRFSDKEPLHEQVYQYLKWSLITGEYAPNEAISIRPIAANLAISTMPVREALKRLVSERAIVSSGNKTYRVNLLEPKRVADLFFIRSNLEGIATELATPLLTIGQMNRLEELASKMDKMEQNNCCQDFREYLTFNYNFHFIIYTATKSIELVSIIEGLWAQVGPFLAASVRETGITPSSPHTHLQIVDALRVRDAELARKLMEEDVSWGTEVFNRIDNKEVN
ncbi:GntR family transcriptional regulator [Marinomonas sp.]|nr:GntR family transcriptional regulator [Marinomonas sp.]MDB4836858.1 GntR family transcriptional regulator [Marinomonas sp.]